MPNRCAIYVRVSTSRQKTENQLPVLQEYAKQRNLEVVAVYEEQESAWKAGHQKKRAELLGAAERHEFDVILVWALDRLSREGALPILSLIHRLKKHGVRIFSYQESWTEMPGEFADVLYSIAGWVDETESRRHSERVKAGIARRKREGGHSGRKLGSKDKRKRQRAGYFLRHRPDLKSDSV